MIDKIYTNRIPDLTERYPEGMHDLDNGVLDMDAWLDDHEIFSEEERKMYFEDRYDESLDWDLMAKADEMNKLNDMPPRFKVVVYGTNGNPDREEFFDNEPDARTFAKEQARIMGLSEEDKDLPWNCYPTIWKQRYDWKWDKLEW